MIDIFVDSLLCRLCGQKGETINYKIRGLSAWHGKSTREDMTTLSGWGVPTAFHKLLEIFQNVSRNLKKLLKNNQTLLFVTKNAQKLLEKAKTSFGLMLKYANCTTKVRL